jgi:diguanylate cyclase (GGDEF)-like protein
VPETAGRPGVKTSSVLVVDDEVNIAHFLKDFLEDNGFTVTLSHTGREGLKAAADQLPDVILLDVDLPDMDGYSVCRSMRQKLSLRNKPILMLTALNDQRNELIGLRAGADDYLTKPVDTGRLLARLNSAIHRNIRELDANPLTHLPGNTSIVQEIEKLIEAKAPYAVLYGDLNNFKTFNDKYGFLRGDQAIKLTAQCLITSVEAHPMGDGPSFVGHVGGDDFVAIVHPDVAEKVCQDIIARFDGMMPSLYDEQDRQNGYIEGKSRQGQPVRHALMGIALVIVFSRDREFTHPGEISSLASELKNFAKTFNKSTYVNDRRRPPDEKPPTTL